MNELQKFPEPLVPADVDLRGLPSFMLNADRLLASELVAIGTAAECWAALMLWIHAWKQVPAGSLPDDDRILAAFSKSGGAWKRIKPMAMRGFIKCSDGRLYHKVLAQEVLQAWERRVDFRSKHNQKTDRQRRWREHVRSVSSELRSLGVTPPSAGASLEALERLLVDAKASTVSVYKTSTDAVYRDVYRDVYSESPSPPGDVKISLKSEGESVTYDGQTKMSQVLPIENKDEFAFVDAFETARKVSKKESKKERKKENKEDTAHAVSSSTIYVFESGLIRLNQKDFDQWHEAFCHLDLKAELIGLTQWAEMQGPAKWFFAVSGALAKKNREAKLAAEKAKSGQDHQRVDPRL